MLERQIMFKQVQELQRQKKLQELNDSTRQNVINKPSLMHNKQSSGPQYGLLNNGIRVRDPSQMFMFGDTNLVQGLSNQFVYSHFQGPTHESAGLLTNHRSQQAGMFGKSIIGDQSNGSSNQDLATLDPLEQKILFNKENDNSSGTESFKNMFGKTEYSSDFSSIQSGNLSALMQSEVAEASSSDENQPSNLVESGKNPTPLLHNIIPDSRFENPKTGDCSGMSGFMDKSPTFPAPNSSGNMFELFHKVDREHNNSVSTNKVPKAETDDALTPSYNNRNNYSRSPYFGLRLTPQSQSQQADHFNKPSQGPKSENNQLPNRNYMTPHPVSVKKEDGQQWSTRSTNIWLDVPLQQNPSVTGSCELPSTSYAANSRIKNSSSIYLQQLEIANQNMVILKSKKRKLSTYERLPWHKEVTEGSSRLHDTSTAELEWAHSVVRLPEKLKEEIADSLWIINRKRRLNLTTQLMQLLFQPPPAIVLSEDATAHCDIVTYYAAKLALGDACSLCLTSGRNIDQDLSKIIEGFIDRSKRLEDFFSRLEKGESLIVELKMDFQDLEKFSFINRFAKFHTRGPMVTGDTSSSTMPKQYPQRYVKASPMPKTVPEGQNCLFL